MKTSAIKITLLLFTLVFTGFASLQAQVYKYSEMDKALSIHPSDSLKEVELLAATEFHVLINKYRVENGKEPLEWSNAHWLASANHNVWMVQHNELAHMQNSTKGYYTGESPGDRIKYVSSDFISCGWSGENCLYNYSSSSFYTNQDKEKHAKSIARASFNQWKGSPGHNANMLGGHSMHGVAFKIDGGKVWATNLFGNCSTNPNHKNSLFSWKGSPNADYVKVDKLKKDVEDKKVESNDDNQNVNGNTRKVTLSNIRKNVLAITEQQFHTSPGKKRYLSKAAQKHASYLAQNGLEETNYQVKNKNFFYAASPVKRLRKATMGKSFFIRGSASPQEEVIVLKYDWADFDLAVAITDLQQRLKFIEKNRLYGYGVEVKRKRGELTIAVVTMVL